MTFLIRSLQRGVTSIAQPVGSEAFGIGRRCFASNSHQSSLIGPAPSQPILPGEPGYGSFLKSMQFASQYREDSMSALTHADMAKLKTLLSQETNSFLVELMNSIKEQNAQMRQHNAQMLQLNKNLNDLIGTLGPRNSQ